MIEIQNLTKRFGALTAVDDVSFSVARGEVLGFLGPNGAGKSTTMKMVTGFLDPTSGTASVCGHDVIQDPIGAQSKIGYLPEGAPLYGDMTPHGLLKFVAEARGIPASQRAQAIDRAVQRVHIEEVLRRRIDTLSKGYKRRVGLAQAIVHDPEVLILDEPTDGLDPNQKHDVRELISEMSRDKVIVLSTHILEEVAAVCSRAIIIAHGKLRFDGTPAEMQPPDRSSFGAISRRRSTGVERRRRGGPLRRSTASSASSRSTRRTWAVEQLPCSTRSEAGGDRSASSQPPRARARRGTVKQISVESTAASTRCSATVTAGGARN